MPGIEKNIALVIPCYKVREEIISVLKRVGPEVSRIYVVDDGCPEKTGEDVEENISDSRVKVIKNETNLGVGGATKVGYQNAMQDGADIIVKIDGDGQMDPSLISRVVRPIREGYADYAKGNRFYSMEFLENMPTIRVMGNAILSFLTKLTSGYWNLMDPTNGYTAIHGKILELLPLEKIEDGFFFENDMLFRLNTIRAVIRDIPMEAKYGNEKSNLKVWQTCRTFPWKLLLRLGKRIYYNYFLRDFNVCSIELILSSVLISFGVCFGLAHWYLGYIKDSIATTGTVMLAALPVILGFQLFLAAVHFDVTNIPSEPLSKALFNNRIE